MPICICPQCSKSHKIPAKNLGLKGRCTQCRAIFDLVEHSKPPVETPRPVAPDMPSIPDLPADPPPSIEPETFSFRRPEPPAPPPQLELPAESVIDDEWGDLDDESFDADDDSQLPRPAKGKIGKPDRVHVAPLRSRPDTGNHCHGLHCGRLPLSPHRDWIVCYGGISDVPRSDSSAGCDRCDICGDAGTGVRG